MAHRTHRLRRALHALAALALSGCGGPPSPAVVTDGATPSDAVVDASVPADGAGPDPAALAACEQDLVASLRAHLPSTGMASQSSAESYDQVIGKLMSDFHIPGGAVAVTHSGKLVFAKAWGFADRDDPQLAHPDDLFRIASVSKQITAAEALELVEAGKLALDERAFDILSDLKPLPGKSIDPKLKLITVRQLLNHTGGWNRDVTGDPMFNSTNIAAAVGVPAPADCSTIIRYMLDKPLTYDPGTTYCYSNFGYCVLGQIIEKRAGGPYADTVKSALLRPAGAPRMDIGHTRAELRGDGEVHYYDYPGAPLAASVFPDVMGTVPWPYGGFYLEAMAAHGAWIASPIDLLRFQVAIDGRGPSVPLLSPQSITAMTANPGVTNSCTANGGVTPIADGYWYGFGWQMNKYGNWWHTGSLPGTATEVVRAQNGYGWAAFFDTRAQDSGPLFNRLDQDLWKAFQGAGAFVDDDLFDQYGAWTDWLSESDYGAAVAEKVFAKLYPSRLEGRSASGVNQFRAQFVPLHDGVTVENGARQDCLEYQDRQTRLAGQGYALINLQSYLDAAGRRRYQAVWQKR